MSNGTRPTAWAVAVCLLVVLSACGATAEDHLIAVSENVDGIERGVLDMRLTLAAASAPEKPIGFAISGPFEVGAEGLEADLLYQQLAGSAEADVRFIAVDGRAFVETEGSTYEVPVEGGPSLGAAPTMLEDLGFEHWAVDPTVVQEGPDDALTIVSPLDELSALEGIGVMLDDLEMKEASGLALFDGLDDETLERSLQGGSMTVRIGPDDLLRGLVVRMRFGIDPSSPLAEALEDVAGTELLFSVEIEDHDQPVRVTTPVDARPISELPGV